MIMSAFSELKRLYKHTRPNGWKENIVYCFNSAVLTLFLYSQTLKLSKDWQCGWISKSQKGCAECRCGQCTERALQGREEELTENTGSGWVSSKVKLGLKRVRVESKSMSQMLGYLPSTWHETTAGMMCDEPKRRSGTRRIVHEHCRDRLVRKNPRKTNHKYSWC